MSVIESVLEDPRPVVRAQHNRARGEAVAAMKAQGLDYDERMAELEDVDHPEPLADLLVPMFEVYRQSPWVGRTRTGSQAGGARPLRVGHGLR